MNRVTIALSVLPFFTQLINSAVPQNLISQTVRQLPDVEIISMNSLERQPPTFQDLCKKITFTKSGLICYFKHIYNCERYAQDVLPIAPFKHLEEFLVHGNTTHQPPAYTKAVFRLFDKKFYAVPFISAVELIPFLKKLPELVQKDLSCDQTRKDYVKQLIRSELENNFDLLKSNPDQFLEQLAYKIVGSDGNQKDISHDQLCVRITRFIHTCLNKLVWNPHDNDEVWQTFMDIGKELTVLKDKGIVCDIDDLDDCQWALTTRFCSFLSLSGTDLSFGFYQKARSDINNGIKHLDDLAEQEEQLTTKREQLQLTIIQSAALAESEHDVLKQTIRE